MTERILERALIEVLNMSLTASVVILAVFAARLLLKRAPRIFFGSAVPSGSSPE